MYMFWEIGAQFGKQHCKDLVMSRKVLSAKIMSDEYDKLKHQVMADIDDLEILFTTDM